MDFIKNMLEIRTKFEI